MLFKMFDKLDKNSAIQHKSLKLRIYPTKEQEELINKTFGCCRKLYNEHLQERCEFYINNILPIKSTATKDKICAIYKTFKPKTEKEWKTIYSYMKDVSSASLQQSRMDCDTAFMNFFKSKNGSRKGETGFPKFKSKKDNHQSYREPNTNESCKVFFEQRLVKIAKLGKVRFKARDFPKWWKQIRLKINCTNCYFYYIII